MASRLSKGMATITEAAIRKWHSAATTFFTITEPIFAWVLKDPKRVLGFDETNFRYDLQGGRVGRVLAPRGCKFVARKATGPGSQITVTHGFSAWGFLFPPTIIIPGLKGQKVTPEMMDIEAYPEAAYICEEGGWQTAETFLLFIKQVDKWLTQFDIPRPVILFCDGHKSHVAFQVGAWARAHQIMIYILRANATNMLQPFDVAIAAQLKIAYQKKIKNFNKDLKQTIGR